MNVDGGLEDIRCIRSLGGEMMPAAFYALLKRYTRYVYIYTAIGEGWSIFVVCFTRGQMISNQTPGRRPPRITVTGGWVGAPNERAPFTIYDVLDVFVGGCLSRTRNLAASN